MKRFAGEAGVRIAFSFGLATIFAFQLGQPAAAQTQERKLSGTFAAFGTFKRTQVGKERQLLTLDENGLSVGNGVLDHMTWHCWGLGYFFNDVGHDEGFCAGQNPNGERVAFNWESEKHAPDQKVVRGRFGWTGGTEKYAGLHGGGSYVDHSGEFRNVTFEGSYIIPGAQ
jgi:hypothetical protein